MNAKDLAMLVGAMREGKGKWKCLCPVHGDKTASLAIADGRRGILLNCRSHQCSVREICQAWGIRVVDLFRGEMTTAQRLILNDHQRLERLRHRHGWMLVGKAIEPEKKAYYDKAILGLEKDIRKLRDMLYPEQAKNRRRNQEFQRNLRLYGWDGLWAKVLPELIDVREPVR